LGYGLCLFSVLRFGCAGFGKLGLVVGGFVWGMQFFRVASIEYFNVAKLEPTT
jgi:hypothetical protein